MKNFFFAFLILFPTLMISQVDATRYWIGGSSQNWTDGANWSTASGGAASSDYPSGDNAIAYLETANNLITINANITLNRLIVPGVAAVPSGTQYQIDASGSSILTLKAKTGGSFPQVIGVSKGGAGLKFLSGTKIKLNGSIANHQFKMNPNGANNTVLSFLDGSEIDVSASKNLVLQSANILNNIYFKGIIKGSGDIKFAAKTTTTFGTTVDMTNFTGDLRGENTATGATTTIFGTVSAAIVYIPGVTGGHTMTVKNSGSLTSSGNLQFNGNSKLIVVGGTGTGGSGSVIAKSTTAAQIRTEFQKPLDRYQVGGSTREWTLISCPVTGETIPDLESQNILSTNGSSKLAFGVFDNASENFSYFASGATDALNVPGKGYLASTAVEDAVLNFFGTFEKTAVVQVPITFESGTYGPWNLVGNPYVSYLNMTDDSDSATENFLTVNAGNIADAYEAVYAWNGTTYTAYNQTTDSKNFIAPGEAFFIYARNFGDPMNMNFKETMQVHSKGTGFNAGVAKGASKSVSRFNIQLKDIDNNQSDELSFYFSNKTSKGLDPGYDAGKFNLAGSESKIFTRLLEDDQESKGLDFQIQALSNDDLKDAVVPLGITTKSSKLELSIKENTLDHLYNVYLEDRLNNTIVEFDKSIELDFDKESEGVGRFYLHFTDGMIPELPTDGDDFRIFKVSNSEIRLMGTPETNYNAKVYDFSGRLVREVNFNHRININEIDSRGINILTIESNDKKLTKKFKLN